jgi:hypothetical protein
MGLPTRRSKSSRDIFSTARDFGFCGPIKAKSPTAFAAGAITSLADLHCLWLEQHFRQYIPLYPLQSPGALWVLMLWPAGAMEMSGNPADLSGCALRPSHANPSIKKAAGRQSDARLALKAILLRAGVGGAVET